MNGFGYDDTPEMSQNLFDISVRNIQQNSISKTAANIPTELR
jgi:hypothetical protein